MPIGETKPDTTTTLSSGRNATSRLLLWIGALVGIVGMFAPILGGNADSGFGWWSGGSSTPRPPKYVSIYFIETWEGKVAFVAHGLMLPLLLRIDPSPRKRERFLVAAIFVLAAIAGLATVVLWAFPWPWATRHFVIFRRRDLLGYLKFGALIEPCALVCVVAGAWLKRSYEKIRVAPSG